MRGISRHCAAAPLGGILVASLAWLGMPSLTRATPPAGSPDVDVASPSVPRDPEEVRAKLEELKSAGAYDTALNLVRDVRRQLTDDPIAAAWWQVETACIATALERACAVPAADRARLAEADRAGPIFEELFAAGTYADAAELARAQLATRRELLGEPDLDVADSHNDLGRALMTLGAYAPAAEELGRALAMRRALLGEEHPLIATSLNNLGAVLVDRGDFMGCRRLWSQALDLRQRLLGPENLQTAGSLNNLGVLYLRLGDYARAARALTDARQGLIARLGENDPATLRTTRNLAIVERERGNLATADSLLVLVVDLQRSDPHQQGAELAWSLFALGEVRERCGQLESAEQLLREAIDGGRAALGERHAAIAPFLHALARTLLRERHLESAEALSREALDILRASLGKSHADLTESLVLLARCRHARGDDLEAVALLEEAARVYETSRRSIELDLVRATFEEPPYERLAAAYLRLDRGDDAWRACERGRGRLLGELLAKDRDQPGDSAVEPWELARIQDALEDQSAIIGWVDVDDEPHGRDSWAYVIRAQGQVHWVRLGSAEQDLPGEVRAELRKSTGLGLAPRMTPALRDLAHRLWLERIAPVIGDLAGAARLMVVPSGAMLGVPIEALCDDEGRFLNERWVVSYAPSATVFAQLRAHARGPASSPLQVPTALLLGDPVLNASEALWPLPWARAELESLRAALPMAEVLAGAAMTEAAVTELATSNRLAEFDIIHFATHALANNEQPELSALALSGPGAAGEQGQGENGAALDGWLTAAEIARTWTLHARLVSLSACETGLGRAVAGEGYVGFAQAFLQAGARNLLVSLWSVSDEATARLMGRFYRNLAEQPAGSESTALRDAKAWLRNQVDDAGRRPWEHPYFWAGFVLFGPGQ
jgi:CHAT domain-containing protein/tetratricopeptide (TPR) repeat protein